MATRTLQLKDATDRNEGGYAGSALNRNERLLNTREMKSYIDPVVVVVAVLLIRYKQEVKQISIQ